MAEKLRAQVALSLTLTLTLTLTLNQVKRGDKLVYLGTFVTAEEVRPNPNPNPNPNQVPRRQTGSARARGDGR